MDDTGQHKSQFHCFASRGATCMILGLGAVVSIVISYAGGRPPSIVAWALLAVAVAGFASSFARYIAVWKRVESLGLDPRRLSNEGIDEHLDADAERNAW